MASFLLQITVAVVIGCAVNLFLRRFFPEAENESIPNHEGAWAVLKPRRWERIALVSIGLACIAFCGFLVGLLVRDYGLGRVSAGEVLFHGAGFGLFFCGGLYLIAFSLRTFVRFDADQLQWSGAIVRHSVKWSDVVALTTHPLLGPRVRLDSGRTHTIQVINGRADARLLEAEAERHGIRISPH